MIRPTTGKRAEMAAWPERSEERISTLTLLRRERIARNTMSFWFRDQPELDYVPGQYMQVVLPHEHPDPRGTKRLFTISSSPTEEEIMLTTKVPEPHSSFKEALTGLEVGRELAVTMLRGSFCLPQDPHRPCAFLAAGIGITPFRSMVKYLVDTDLSYPLTLVYGEWGVEDFIFEEVFEEGKNAFGLRPVYTITGPDVPLDWQGRTGLIDARLIREEVPDYFERLFLVCGSPAAVMAIERVLAELDVSRENIQHDYFPGY